MKKFSKPCQQLDLRGTPCPVNFIRCCLAIEELEPNQLLQIELDRGDPEQMVIHGLRNKGHDVEVVYEESSWIRLMVNCSDR